MFKIGDKVKVIDDEIQGEIIQVLKNEIVLLSTLGFEYTYSPKDLILDQFLDIGEVETEIFPTKSKEKNAIRPKSKSPFLLREIDLHIGKLVDYPKALENYEIIQLQISVAREEIEKALIEPQIRLIFIHGHGKGVLRRKLYALLDSYSNLEYFDASFQRYNMGATEVRFY